MQFRLTYTEVEKMIANNTGKELPMCYGGTHTLRVTHKVPFMGSVGLDITVEEIKGSDVIFSFSGGPAIEYMLRTAINKVKDQPGGEMLEMLGGNRLMIALGRNAKTVQIFERIDLEDIHFDEQTIMFDFMTKSF